jgi:hypothetical protein
MSQETTLYISDKTGKKFWNTVCSTEFKAPEIRNLERHLRQAKIHPVVYAFLDLDTARIYEDGVPIMTDDELLAELA